MNIQKKIEEIRRKPESVRLRYAWGFSFVCLFLILIIWIISFIAQRDRSENENFPKSQQEIIEEFRESKKGITDTAKDMKSAIDNYSDLEKAKKDEMLEK